MSCEKLFVRELVTCNLRVVKKAKLPPTPAPPPATFDHALWFGSAVVPSAGEYLTANGNVDSKTGLAMSIHSSYPAPFPGQLVRLVTNASGDAEVAIRVNGAVTHTCSVTSGIQDQALPDPVVIARLDVIEIEVTAIPPGGLSMIAQAILRAPVNE